MVQKLEDRPPFVRFETRSIEDRAASLEAGHYVGQDIDYALITPTGSKDCIERIVTEWFSKLEQDVVEDRCPREWFRHFKEIYKEWKEGREIPANGFPITDWSPASPSQVKTMLSLHVRTVEDLATANEEVLSRMGMGARALKQRAADWLESSKGAGKTSADIESLRASVENLTARNAQLEAQLKAAVAKMPAETPDKRKL